MRSPDRADPPAVEKEVPRGARAPTRAGWMASLGGPSPAEDEPGQESGQEPGEVRPTGISSAVRGFVLQPACRYRRGRLRIELAGVLESGEPFLVEDDRFLPYAFVREADLGTLGPTSARVAACGLRALGGDAVVRLEVDANDALLELRRTAERARVRLHESDLRPESRYLIDRGLGASLEIRGAGRPDGFGRWCFQNPELRAADFAPRLRVLSIDIETTPDASRVYSVALLGAGLDEVHLVARRPVDGACVHPDERALLEVVGQRIRGADPDVLTGWNVVDFDLAVLAARFRACRLPFALGRDDSVGRLVRDATFTRQSRADLAGRQVLDALGLVRDAFIPLDDYRLETAARSLLGRGKRIDARVTSAAEEIGRMYREDPAALVVYNREDARLVLDILEQERLIELAVERSLVTGMQLDRVGASIASFDRLYLPALRRRGYVAPDVERERPRASIQGGAVLDSAPGLFRNVAVFDFKSLYPSLMRTFDLDPLAHALAREAADPLVAPNGAGFARGRGILPDLLETLGARRARARDEGREHADLAIKIFMNACFGVMAARSCRFFDPELANAITHFGQQTLGWAKAAFEAQGARVLYGDTDSVFVALDPTLSVQDAHIAAEGLRDAVQEAIAARVRNTYRVEPALELELEKVYARYFQPQLRGRTQGSKKRYAGLVENAVEVVGLEAVRRDWPPVVRRLQIGMLERWFTDRPVLPFVRDVVEEVRTGRCDQELVVRKRLRKGGAERYSGRTPPHVRAARKAGLRGGSEIRYVLTRAGPEPVLDGRPFPDGLDYDYYLDRMLRPVADAILRHLDQSFDEAIGRPRQLRLL